MHSREFSKHQYIFFKHEKQLITSKSSSSTAQLDYLLTKRSALRSVRDVKVIQHEECITQHKHLICNNCLKKSKMYCYHNEIAHLQAEVSYCL